MQKLTNLDEIPRILTIKKQADRIGCTLKDSSDIVCCTVLQSAVKESK